MLHTLTHIHTNAHVHTIKGSIINSERLKTSSRTLITGQLRCSEGHTNTHTHSSWGHNLRPDKARNKSRDKRMDGNCFSVSVGSLVLIAKGMRYKTMAKASSKLLLSSLHFFPLFLHPFFFLYAPGVNKRKRPVARKTTLYMKRFMLSLVCVMNPNHRLSIPQSPTNMFLAVAVRFGSTVRMVIPKRRIYQLPVRLCNVSHKITSCVSIFFEHL